MIASHRYYGALRFFRNNRYRARTPVTIVLMLVVWLPMAASGCCLFGACAAVATTMGDCPSRPVMKAADSSPLIDQVMQPGTTIKALHAPSARPAMVRIHCAKGDGSRYHYPPAQTLFCYEFCTLLM
jgi:hypothetical protein